MKIRFILLLLLSFAFVSQGQMTNFSVTGTLSYENVGLIYYPPDYATATTKKYPLVIFHAGTGVSGNRETLRTHDGLPNLINSGIYPINIVSPKDGQTYSFIAIAGQSGSSNDDIRAIEYMLSQGIRIDTNKVYITGVSAGGQNIVDWLTNHHPNWDYNGVSQPEALAKYVSAVAPFSGPYYMNFSLSYSNASTIQAHGIKFWLARNQGDGIAGDGPDRTADTLNAYTDPDVATFTEFTNFTGHSGNWSYMMNPNNDVAPGGKNMYEWFLTYTKDKSITKRLRLRAKIKSL
jgi:hypothetical protein